MCIPSQLSHIREPEIAECSKNARICNILFEIFHILLIFHKKNTFPYSCSLLVSIYPFVLINLLSTMTFTCIHCFSDIITKNFPKFYCPFFLSTNFFVPAVFSVWFHFWTESLILFLMFQFQVSSAPPLVKTSL